MRSEREKTMPRIELTFWELDLIEKAFTTSAGLKPVASFREKDRDSLISKVAAAKKRAKRG